MCEAATRIYLALEENRAMKQLASLMIAVAALLSAAPATAVEPLRIQAWNLFQCNGTDNVCNLTRQAATMAASNPDIILTSEIIDSHIPTYIAELNRLTNATWHWTFVPICERATCDGGHGQGQAIFSRIAPSSTSRKFFSGQDRSAVAMVFNDINGRRVAVVSTHLAANNWDQQPPGSGVRAADNANLRVSAMAEMKDWAATLAPAQIIGGDFNFNPTMTFGGTTEISRMTTAGYIESWQKTLGEGMSSSYPDNPPSLSTWTRRSRIDYIFYLGAGLNAVSSNIRDIRDLSNPNVAVFMGNADDRGVRPSDHNMVETVIAVSPGTSDTTPPTATITAPTAGPVSGPVTVRADANDNIAVAGVQFTLDGQNLGAEDTTFPYSTEWNTLAANNGNHVLRAVARDTSGNLGTSAPVSVTVDNPAGTGLIGHWKFDEGSNLTAADSVGGATGTLVNNPAWTNGKVGGALQFNGTTQFVQIQNQPSWNRVSSKYTVAFWIQVNQVKNYAGVVALGNWGTGQLEVITTDNRWSARIRTSGGANGWGCDVTSSTLGYLMNPESAFHHVAVVLDATASRCYLYSDGQRVGTDEYVDGTTSFGSAHLNVGGFGDANRLPSIIDDVRIYNTALSQAEVQELVGTTPPNPGLVGHWKFDEGSNTTAADSAGGATGTLVNSPVWTNGKIGGALRFNGTTQFVQVLNQPSWNKVSSKYTVAFWVQVHEVKNYAGAVALGNWGTGQLEIITTDNRWSARIRTSGGANGWGCDVTSSTLGYLMNPESAFHHVAVVLDAAASRCYLYSDGQRVGTDEYVDGTTFFGAAPLNIGGFGDANRLPSTIDDVRLYDTALSEAEIQALVTGGGQ
jgi:endonuclease/exonuclease/phosphatase family metal-dependent hydrolase